PAPCRPSSWQPCSSTSARSQSWAPTSSRAACACWPARPKRWRDAGQLGLRRRGLRTRRRRVRRLLAMVAWERTRAAGAAAEPPTVQIGPATGRSGLAGAAPMKPKFVAGGVVIALALGYMIWAGVSQSVVYFVTPSELTAAPVAGKAYRLGGVAARGGRRRGAPPRDPPLTRCAST